MTLGHLVPFHAGAEVNCFALPRSPLIISEIRDLKKNLSYEDFKL